MSYARCDDRCPDGSITELRRRLSAEVRVHIGQEFPIFQDIDDIKWGQSWEDRINESLDDVTFLIPIVTPSFLNSCACRAELKRFLHRERALKRRDLILPVYYIECPNLHDQRKVAQDVLVGALLRRNYVDWRDLRLKPFTAVTVRKRLTKLAVHIRDALYRVGQPER